MNTRRRCLSLAKGRHRYVFRYCEGQESRLLATFAELAADRHTNFDWMDAAVLSYQMGKRIGNRADRRVEIAS